MPVEKMHPSLLRVNQHTERVRKELRESLLLLLNRVNDESVSKELSDLGQEIRSKLGEFE